MMRKGRKLYVLGAILAALVLVVAALARPILDATLMFSSGNGNLAGARMSLRLGADPNATNYSSGGALQSAAYGGHNNIVLLLLAAGANPNLYDKYNGGYTALMDAAERGHLSTVRILLQHGADPNVGPVELKPLRCAHGESGIIRLLVQAGAHN